MKDVIGKERTAHTVGDQVGAEPQEQAQRPVALLLFLLSSDVFLSLN